MMKTARLVLLSMIMLLGVVTLTAAQTEYDTYLSYFNSNEKVKSFTLDTLTLKEKLLFWQYIIDLEENGEIEADKPQSLGDGYLVEYSSSEVSSIVAAKYAHAIWLDKNNIVLWDLADYSSDELSILFSKQSIFEQGNRHSLVGDYNPSELFFIHKNLIENSVEETIYAVLEEYRDTFRHGLNGEPMKKISQDIVSVMEKNEYGQRVSYSGCHSMSKIVEYTLRNFNIPAYEGHTPYGGGGHASIFFPTLGKVALHGDDVYSAGKKGMPFEAMMMDDSTLKSIEEDCKDNRECEAEAFEEWEIKQMLPYVADTKYHIQRCCRRDFGFSSCEEYVDKGFPHADLLNGVEKEQMISELKAAC